MEFYIPSDLVSNFDDMLDIFGTTVTVNYNASTPTTNVKVQYQNLNDNARTLRFKLTDTIIKGDYLTDGINDITYLVSWSPYKDINSYRSQAQICNTTLDIESWADAILDSSGITATPAGYVAIVNDLVSFTSRTGMGIFSSSSSEIGIVPSGKMMVGTQFNAQTTLIKIGDEFSYRNTQYRITDLDLSQLDDTESIGIFIMYVERLEGGRRSVTV